MLADSIREDTTRRPLVEHPEDWPWSSYPGYCDARKRVDWVSYDKVLSAWKGEVGGADAAAAYRRFVESGWREQLGNPFDRAEQGWILGSGRFVERIRSLVAAQQSDERQVPKARRLKRLETREVLETVAEFYGVSTEVFQTKRVEERSRNVAAWLARHLTQATLRELAPMFGLCHPESLSNLTRRIDQSLTKSPELAKRNRGDQATITAITGGYSSKPDLTLCRHVWQSGLRFGG